MEEYEYRVRSKQFGPNLSFVHLALVPDAKENTMEFLTRCCTPPPLPDPSSDAAPDAATDAAPDATPDAAPDTSSDAAPALPAKPPDAPSTTATSLESIKDGEVADATLSGPSPSSEAIRAMPSELDADAAPIPASTAPVATPTTVAVPRPKWTTQEEERKKQLELEKEKQMLDSLEAARLAKNEKLAAKVAEKKRKERVKQAEQSKKEQAVQEKQFASELQGMRTLGPAEFEARMRPMFDAMDKDQSGSIDIAELRKAMVALKQPMSDAQLAAMMKEADSSGDGTIDLAEFAAIVRKQLMEGSGAWGRVADDGGKWGFGWLFGSRRPSSSSAAQATKTATPQAASAPDGSPTHQAGASSMGASPQAKATSGQLSPRGTGLVPSPSSCRTASSTSAAQVPSSPVKSSSQAPSTPVKSSPVKASSPSAGAAHAALPSTPGGASSLTSSTLASSMGSEAEVRAKVRAAFNAFDTDGSGAISASELASVLKRIGMPKSGGELAALMKEADPDGSGEIDFEECVSPIATGGPLSQALLRLAPSCSVLLRQTLVRAPCYSSRAARVPPWWQVRDGAPEANQGGRRWARLGSLRCVILLWVDQQPLVLVCARGAARSG